MGARLGSRMNEDRVKGSVGIKGWAGSRRGRVKGGVGVKGWERVRGGVGQGSRVTSEVGSRGGRCVTGGGDGGVLGWVGFGACVGFWG